MGCIPMIGSYWVPRLYPVGTIVGRWPEYWRVIFLKQVMGPIV